VKESILKPIGIIFHLSLELCFLLLFVIQFADMCVTK